MNVPTAYRFWTIALLFVAAVSTRSQSTAQSTAQPATAELSEEQEAERVDLESLIMSPCCWAPLIDHDSGISKKFKHEIRHQILAGRTQDEIIAAFVNQEPSVKAILDEFPNMHVEGAQILAKPPATGFNRIAYIMPVVAVFLGFYVVSRLFRRLQAAKRRAQPSPAQASSSKEAPQAQGEASRHRAQIEQELDNYDF